MAFRLLVRRHAIEQRKGPSMSATGGQSNKVKIGVLGASGYTGAELVRNNGPTFEGCGQRKNYEEAEANAIGTEYLRADLLAAEVAASVR